MGGINKDSLRHLQGSPDRCRPWFLGTGVSARRNRCVHPPQGSEYGKGQNGMKDIFRWKVYMPSRSLIEALYTVNSPPVVSSKGEEGCCGVPGVGIRPGQSRTDTEAKGTRFPSSTVLPFLSWV